MTERFVFIEGLRRFGFCGQVVEIFRDLQCLCQLQVGLKLAVCFAVA